MSRAAKKKRVSQAINNKKKKNEKGENRRVRRVASKNYNTFLFFYMYHKTQTILTLHVKSLSMQTSPTTKHLPLPKNEVADSLYF
jgi:hypothetical protein